MNNMDYVKQKQQQMQQGNQQQNNIIQLDLQNLNFQPSHHRISQLYSELQKEFKITLEEHHEQKKNQQKRRKRQLKVKEDFQANSKRLENKMRMNEAQRYLDERIRLKWLRRSRKNANPEEQEPYQQRYQKFQRSKTSNNVFGETDRYYTQPEKSPEGIYFYDQIEGRNKILNHIKERLNKKNKIVKNQQSEQKTRFYFLKKRKSIKLSESTKIPTLEQRKNYSIENSNKKRIGTRLQKYYSKKPKEELSLDAVDAMNHSPILEAQKKIFTEVWSARKQKNTGISKKSSQELEQKFNQILKLSVKSIQEKNKRLKLMTRKKQLPKIQLNTRFDEQLTKSGESK